MIVLNGRYWFSKKFQGIGILFDFDVPQANDYTVMVFKFKLLFFGCWIDITRRNYY